MCNFLLTLGYVFATAAITIGGGILAGLFIRAGRGDDDDEF